MSSPDAVPEPRKPVPPRVIEAVRKALAAASPRLDVAAVALDTPLATLFFDSLTAVTFIARLEEQLGVCDLPFERWLREHSECTDLLTVASLVSWLASIPGVVGRAPAREAGAPASSTRADRHRR